MIDLKHATLLKSTTFENLSIAVNGIDKLRKSLDVYETKVIAQKQWQHLLIQTQQEPLNIKQY